MKALLALALLMIVGVAGAQVGSLTGFVRDEQGAPIQGAQLTLVRNEQVPRSLSTTSDEQGAYHFADVPAGDYRLSASFSGFTTSQSEVTISSPSSGQVVAVTMRKSADPPQFAAAGVRGLIDPGGYSATTQATAASGLIKGIADIKRGENNATTAGQPGTACSLEPKLKRAATESPDSLDANLNLGEFYLAHGQALPAIPLLERAHVLKHRDQAARSQLAEAYLRVGRFQAASQLLSEPGDAAEGPAIHRLHARADEGMGQFAEAEKEYKLAAQQEPAEENLFGAGYELILEGLPKDAERSFAASVTQHPQSQQLLIGLGSAQFLGGHAAESVQTLLRAAEINPKDPRPYPFLSQASGISNEDALRVRRAFDRYVMAAPDDPHAYYYSALNLLHQPAAEGAEDARIETLLQHAIQLDDGLADAHYQLGVLDGRRGAYPLAAQELETAVRLSPTFADAHYHLAIAYRRIGRPAQSAQEMQRFQELRKFSTVQTAEGKTNIDPFISVLAEPAAGKRPESLCPGDSP